MKDQKFPLHDHEPSGVKSAKTISLERAREICKEEELDYSREELVLILDFVSKVVSITTSHYERTYCKAAWLLINTNHLYEAESILIHPGQYGRTGGKGL
jgi:hypothetical protein